MDQVHKAIQARQLSQTERIDIEKGGKPLPVGTVRKRGDNNYIKTASGWKYHGRANQSQRSEPTAEPPKAKVRPEITLTTTGLDSDEVNRIMAASHNSFKAVGGLGGKWKLHVSRRQMGTLFDLTFKGSEGNKGRYITFKLGKMLGRHGENWFAQAVIEAPQQPAQKADLSYYNRDNEGPNKHDMMDKQKEVYRGELPWSTSGMYRMMKHLLQNAK